MIKDVKRGESKTLKPNKHKFCLDENEGHDDCSITLN